MVVLVAGVSGQSITSVPGIPGQVSWTLCFIGEGRGADEEEEQKQE